MSEDRLYSDEEFALILRKASELQTVPDELARPGGLTLSEMKAIAAEAGLDPEAVERAAGLVPRTRERGALERIVGGPLKHRLEHAVPVELTDERIGALAAAIREAADNHGTLEANVAGLEWRSEGVPSQIFVTAARGKDETRVTVAVDRSSSAVLTGLVNLTGGFVVATLVGAVVDPEVAAAPWILGGGLAGGLAMARVVWGRTARSVRRRVDTIMDRITRTLREDEDRDASPPVNDSSSGA